jgi:probable F420-dependent oxidoreductase
MFSPLDNEHAAPRVMLAGVGPRMTRVAGEVADGFLAHSFTTARYMREVTLPALERGLAASGRSRSEYEIACPVLTVSGANEQAYEASRQEVCQRIAFYGSTPAYRPVLEAHGWGDLQSELRALSKQEKWVEMGALIEDDILEEFAIVAEPEDIPSRLKQRYGGLIDSWICSIDTGDPVRQRELLSAVQG